MARREIVDEFVMAPATGKAVPVMRGHVLRIEQVGAGQCLDFNAYNLHDYKEQFHTGRTRYMQGMNPTKGDHLWSAPPRDRPMMTIIADTVGTNDIMFPRCSGLLFEYSYGYCGHPAHSNCHDIFSEAIREWELTPDDVHDSFNGFMHTRIKDGRMHIDRMIARRGDYIDLLAQIDVLAVPICCGADIGATNNYELKGLKVTIFEGTAEDHGLLQEASYTHQRKPEEFKLSKIKATRELRRDLAFKPEWPWRDPVDQRNGIEIEFSEQEQAVLAELRQDPEFRDFTDAEIVRYCFFRWYSTKHRRTPAKVI